MGEVGNSLSEILEKNNDLKIYRKDAIDFEIRDKIDVMHICIPYSDDFVDIIVGYIKKYSP